MSSSARSLRVQLIVFAVVALALAVAAVVTFVVRDDGPASQADPARLNDPKTVAAFISSATSAVAVVTSYDYRDLDDALRAGTAATTGTYQRSFRSAFAGLRAGAIGDHAVQTFEQLRIGIGQLSRHDTIAQLLVFGTERRSGAGGTTAQDVTLHVTLVHRGSAYLISDLAEDENAGLPPGSEGLRAAAEAGRSEVVAVNSYRRAHFDADLQTALDGAAGTLSTQLRTGAPSTRAALTKGRYDLSGAVTAVAVENVAPSEVTLLMAATGIKIAADGGRSRQTMVRFEVTVQRIGGNWRTTQLAPVRGAA